MKQVYLQFGIDLAASNGNDDWTLPIPARYVVTPDAVVRSASIDADYTRRPEPSDTIDFLRAMND